MRFACGATRGLRGRHPEKPWLSVPESGSGEHRMHAVRSGHTRWFRNIECPRRPHCAAKSGYSDRSPDRSPGRSARLTDRWRGWLRPECQIRALRLNRSSRSQSRRPRPDRRSCCLDRKGACSAIIIKGVVRVEQVKGTEMECSAEIDHDIGVGWAIIGVQPVRAVLCRFINRPGLMVKNGRRRKQANCTGLRSQ